MDFAEPQFWVAVAQIIAIDIVLGGDNAVVIALACRKLAPAQRRLGIIWGTAGAIGLRVVLVFFAISLLSLPYLKLVGAAALLWIGVKLMQPERESHGDSGVAAATSLSSAIRIIVVADLVMSIDNVIAIAAASKGSLGLVVFGLIVSVPIIVWGSQIVLRFMDRFPVIVTIGAALLGWIAGDLAVTDPAISEGVQAQLPWLPWISPVLGAVFVVGLGKLLAATGGPRAAPALTTSAAADGQVSANAMASILVPVDGSDSAERALTAAMDLARQMKTPAALELVNVQRPVRGDVSMFVGQRQVDEYHREEGLKALSRARARLGASGLAGDFHIGIGDPAEVILQRATQSGCALICMSTHGAGAVGSAMLGSVAQQVVHGSRVPVMLVK